MTTPQTHRLGTDQRGTRGIAAGVVSVSRSGWRWHGHCTCRRWRFRRRVLRSVAVLDALTHAARCGCEPAVPLVDHGPGRPYRSVQS